MFSLILIRGIRGETYARKIEKGLVGCRDILSAILDPPKTGYAYSDYYEKNLVRALIYFWKRNVNLHDPDFLYSLLIDYYIPHIYLTYFHVLNEQSLKWLDNFEDDYYFIAVNVKIDRITKAAIGTEYFGSKMTYVSSITQLDQTVLRGFQIACLCSLEKLFKNKAELPVSINLYNTLAFPLLCREQDDRFTDIENEFRIIAYDCPRMKDGRFSQIPREVIISGESGINYCGTLNAGVNSILKNNTCLCTEPYDYLRDILSKERGKIKLNSKFKDINIREISNNYLYLGNKVNCAEYIRRQLEHMSADVIVNRTMYMTREFGEKQHAIYFPKCQEVKY